LDDFILLNIFGGVDFLPRLPGMEINEESLDNLLYIYKRMLPFLNGYLSDNGRMNLNLGEINI
jgi:5'-3' exonuclease